MAETTIKPLSKSELSSFCAQMSMILTSGISCLEGLSLMLMDVRHPEEKRLLENLSETYLATGYLYTAMEATKAFPDYMIEMVEIGENTGRLDDVLQALSEHYDREDALSRSIRHAITYPLIIVCMMLAVIIVLITKVMPIFNQVFKQLGQEMTGFSKAILDFGTVINNYAIVIVIIIAILIGAALYFTLTKSGKAQFSRMLVHSRIFRSYQEKISLCRFAGGMSLTLDSGLTPEDSVRFSAKLVEDPVLSKTLEDCIAASEAGQDIFEALLQAGIFTGVHARLANIGHKTGTLETAMKKIAIAQQEELDTRLSNMISVLEPTLVVVLSVIVGLILLSVMLPLIGIMSNL